MIPKPILPSINFLYINTMVKTDLKKAKILFVRGDLSACYYYRIYLPWKALEAKGYNVNIDPDYEDFKSADILIFQRQYREEAINEIIRWKKAGKKIVIDYDDNLFIVDPHNPAVRVFSGDVLEKMEFVITIADALTVSVKPLADSFRRFNDNIFVLPNSIDEAAFKVTKKVSENTIVGWQGGSSHREDLRIIKSVINDLSSKLTFDFVLAGYHPKGFFKKSTYRHWLPFSEDLAHHQLFSDFDIGLCPLKDTPFNECKSDIKFLEYASLEIPTIASNIVTYKTIVNGVTGYLARNQSDWSKHISELITDESKRKEISKNASEYVLSERTIQKNVWRWKEFLSSL